MAEWPMRQTASGVTVVSPGGRLNMVAAPDLREQLRGLVQSGSARVVVDLSDVESIDSSGLGALISGLKAARNAGGDLRIVAPNAQVTAVLELTNLNRVLNPRESAEKAFDDPD
ncbi:MAG: STAS domain-containing protein [Actinomycetia bacterium]|nr:STAS domain-containing protein [Actinomycetes bacterium]